MIEEITATQTGQATGWLPVKDWSTIEFIIFGMSNANSLVYLEWKDLYGDPTVRTIVAAAATPTAGQVSNGLYTLQLAPRKQVRLYAETVGGTDSIYLRVSS